MRYKDTEMAWGVRAKKGFPSYGGERLKQV